MNDKAPRSYLIDMTLALGADSYLQQRNPRPEGICSDPAGESCLRDFVDVIVNSSTCYFALPSENDYWIRPALLRGITALQIIPKCAGVPLKDSVERRVFAGFQETYHDLGHEWVSSWFLSHVLNPVVNRYHNTRLGAKARSFITISEDGWEVWDRYFDKSEIARWKPLTEHMPREPYLLKDTERAGGLAKFQYCYVFDVYRRGWQYAEAARMKRGGISYCPHQLRRRALEAGADGWLVSNRERFWSWGEAIIGAIKAASHKVEAQQVSDWINGLLVHKSPRWIDVPTHGEDRAMNEQIEKELFERVDTIAREVGLQIPVVRSGAGAFKKKNGIRDVDKVTLSPSNVLQDDYEHRESCFRWIGPAVKNHSMEETNSASSKKRRKEPVSFGAFLHHSRKDKEAVTEVAREVGERDGEKHFDQDNAPNPPAQPASASIALRDAADKINIHNLTPKKAEAETASIPNQPSGTENPEAELHKLAPTLVDLRKLAPEQKDRLLLAQLAKTSRHNESMLNKHNLTLSGDPYGMARLYSETERREVVEHLLAAPWTRLVNNGYLADFSGHGFYKVTTDGHEYLREEAARHVTPAISNTAVTLSTRIEGAPRVFLSYSWEGDDHKAWVKGLAERLQADGIQVIFDRWHLKLGQDKLHFMESAVADSDYVAIICTEEYANRANQREGGVGWESMIITSEIAEHILTDKFIPILRKGTFKTSLPRYLRTRMGVNLMGDPYNDYAYEELLRRFHGEPIAPPPIGAKPDFSKKTAPNPKTLLHAAGEALAKQSEGTLLGPLSKRPNATLHAQYDKPGTPGPWLHAIIRQWDLDGEVKYSLETSRGDEFIGIKDDAISMFSNFNRKLIKEGYKRMSFSPGADPDFQSL
jgi:hypothetical protein